MLLDPTWNNLRLKVLLALIIEMIFSSRHWPIISIALLNTTESIWSCSISKFSCTPFESRANLLSVWAYLITLLELLINWYSKSSQLSFKHHYILLHLLLFGLLLLFKPFNLFTLLLDLIIKVIFFSVVYLFLDLDLVLVLFNILMQSILHLGALFL
jgi:hypothetical protein